MFTKIAIRALQSLVAVAGSVILCGCVKSPAQPIVEQPVPPQEAVSLPQPTQFPELPPPKRSDVEDAVKRIFKDVVVIDEGHKPNFLVGDFNGDLSQDLAVVLKPAEGKLSDLNQEFPNWIAREPIAELLLPKSKVLVRQARVSPSAGAGQTVRFRKEDVLLAVVHGQGPKGWHDPEATQTHLMRDVVGANMRVLPYKDAAKTYRGTKPFPNVLGDLIQQTLIGQAGFIHFGGSLYSWYDPKNYQPVVMPTHSAMSRMR
jgi:hypothetical protein